MQPQRTCSQCGTTETSRWKAGMCNACYQRARLERLNVERPARACPFCEQSFHPGIHAKGEYCSRSCWSSAHKRGTHYGETQAERMRRWRAENPERDQANWQRQSAMPGAIAKRRAWNEANRERIRATSKAYYEAHKPENLEKNYRRRSRERSQYVERVDRRVVYERDSGICQHCRKAVAYRAMTLDHIVPLAAGGEHSYRNTQLSCRPCNERRGHRGPAQLRLLG